MKPYHGTFNTFIYFICCFFVINLIGGFVFDSLGQEAAFFLCAGFAILDLLARLVIDPPSSIEEAKRRQHVDIKESNGADTSPLLPEERSATVERRHHQRSHSVIGYVTLLKDPQMIVTWAATIALSSVYSGMVLFSYPNYDCNYRFSLFCFFGGFYVLDSLRY